MEKVLEIEPVELEAEYFCWAGCIQMVATFYNKTISQCEIVKEINESSTSCSAQKLQLNPAKKDYQFFFTKININCTQQFTKIFPDFKFIISQIDKNDGNPIIYSGIYYPLLQENRHAITAVGYYVDKNQSPETDDDVNILLINDPFQKEYKYRAAWVYKELIEHHQSVKSNETKYNSYFDIIHSFKETTPDSFQIDTESISYNALCNETDLQKSIYNFIKRNNSILESFFRLQEYSKLLNSIKYKSIDVSVIRDLFQ